MVCGQHKKRIEGESGHLEAGWKQPEIFGALNRVESLFSAGWSVNVRIGVLPAGGPVENLLKQNCNFPQRTGY